VQCALLFLLPLGMRPFWKQGGYATTAPLKRLVIAADVGHQFCSDLCWIGAAQGGIAKIAFECGITIGAILGRSAVFGAATIPPFPAVTCWCVVLSCFSFFWLVL
jgi:hypothetical protein